MEAPSIRTLRPGAGNTLGIVWRDGAESVVDLTDYIDAYEVFGPLRGNPSAFSSVATGDWGWSAHWTDDMGISAGTLWRMSLEQGAAWLRNWRKGRRLSQAAAAAALGVSPRMWRYYEAATHLLPKTVQLACIGYDVQTRAA